MNAGTWMWLSCSSFFQQFFHCYSPVRFGRKVDPEGDYIRSEAAAPWAVLGPEWVWNHCVNGHAAGHQEDSSGYLLVNSFEV